MAEPSATSSAQKLVFACSGCADVGEISDLAARRLLREGAGKMFCLAGIGAGLETFTATTMAAPRVLVIDGCPMDCAKKILEGRGIRGFAYMHVTDLGMEKGKSPATEERVQKVVAHGAALLKGAGI